MAGFYSILDDRFYNKYAVKTTIMFTDVYRFEANTDCTFIYDATADRISICKRIGDRQTQLNLSYLYRPHKSWVVSIGYIAHLEKPKDGYTGLWIRLKNDAIALCARDHIEELCCMMDLFKNGKL